MKDSIVGTEKLPNAHIEKIVYQISSTGYRVKISVCVYDYKKQTWSATRRFFSVFGLRCVTIGNPSLIKKINNGQETIRKNFVPTDQADVKEGLFSGMVESEVNIRGKDYIKFKKEFIFEGDQTYSNFSCYAHSFIKMGGLNYQQELDLSFTGDDGSYYGALAGEKIIEKFKFFNSSVIFRNPETLEPWSGPIHQAADGSYMEGSFHSSNSHNTLEGELVLENPKLVVVGAEVGDLGQVGTNPFGASIDNNKPVETYEEKTYANHYQMEYFEDSKRNLNNIVILDLQNFILDDSRMGRLLYENDPDLFISAVEQTNILNLKVKRHEVFSTNNFNRFGLKIFSTNFAKNTLIASSFNSHSKLKTRTLYQTSPRSKYSIDDTKMLRTPVHQVFDGKKISSDVLKTSRKIGSVEQMNVSMPSNFRAIKITDYDVSSNIAGKYKYSIELETEDVFIKFFERHLKDLNTNYKKIEGLLNSLVLKNVFKGDSFSIEFLQQFYGQYDVGIDDEGVVVSGIPSAKLNDSYIMRSHRLLAKTERYLGRQPSSSHTQALNLFLTDLEKIEVFLKYYSDTIDDFKRYFDLSDGMSFEQSSANKRKDRPVIKKTIKLKEVYEKKQHMPISLSFIGEPKVDENILKISLRGFKDRSNLEYKKFFAGPVDSYGSTAKNLPADQKAGLLSATKEIFSNFTPTVISLGNNKMNMSKINENSFNVDFYNNLRIAKSAIKFQQRVGDEEEGTQEEPEDENLVDSKDFLGSRTKFNSLIIREFKNKSMKIAKFRKRFRFFDNKTLLSNSKKLSLKSYDLTAPDNKVAKLLKSNPKNVPLQIKALSLLKTPATTFNIDKLKFDPLSNPQTQEVIEQNFLNIGKVQVLKGFEKINGRFMMSSPVFQEMEYDNIDELEGKNYLCRIVDSNALDHQVDNTGTIIQDKIFMLESSQEDQSAIPDESDRQQINLGTETTGEETDSLTLLNIDRTSIFTSIVTQNKKNFNIINAIPLEGQEITTEEDVTINTVSDTTPANTQAGAKSARDAIGFSGRSSY